MFHSSPPKAMIIGAGKHLEATGIIKKVFPKRPDPYGFLLLLTPLELRGQEASFFCDDINIRDDEREHLRAGMQLKFKVIDKPLDNMRSPVNYKAIEMIPLTPSHYQAVVVRPPAKNGNSLRVAVDLTLEQVKITQASYVKLNLKNDLKLGDPCVIQLTWKELVSATKDNRQLEGEIISACRLAVPLGCSGQETETVTEETTPTSEDSSPENPEHSHRGGKSTPRKLKEPIIRIKPGLPTTPKLFDSFKADDRCQGSKQNPRCCPAPCCQDQSFLSPKIPPFPLPPFNGACACAGCLMMQQNYAMIPPGYLPCYNMNVGAPSWSKMNGC